MRVVRSDGPGMVRLALHGELDLATADLAGRHIAVALDTIPAGGPPLLVLDVAGLTFCDSAGIDVLLGGRAGAQAREVDFRVVGARGIVRRSMAATGVLTLLTTA